ncbi:MAG: Ig-like domain-containing protein, partial [Wenzhouxiangellaceae bacterium]
DLTETCAGGRWQHGAGDGPLAEGLYWVPCDVSLNVSDLSGAISVVASGSIQVNGSNVEGLTHFSDGILFWSEAAGRAAIKLSGSGLNLTGYQFARNGQIDISGSSMVLACGLAADSIKLNGSNHLFSGDGCSTPTADDLVVTTTQGEALTIQLSGGDLDGDALGFSIASSPQHGLLNGGGDLYTYQPDPEFIGDDAFTYQVDDGLRRSAPAMVSIIVTAADVGNGPLTEQDREFGMLNEGLSGDGGDQAIPIPALDARKLWLLTLMIFLLGCGVLNSRRRTEVSRH